MKASRFSGKTSREVLGKIRQTLGTDALIVSSRPVAGGIEIIAAAGSALTVDDRAAKAADPVAQDRSMPDPLLDTATALGRDGVSDILRELQEVRGMVQRELAALACTDLQRRDPARSALLRDLLAAGISPELGRSIVDGVPAGGNGEHAARSALSHLGELLPIADPDELVERGGVYALVGPTGVGKTTTVAKIAARCVIRHGAAKVALMTTDSYRIAAHDQLRVYGKILGLPVHAVRDAADLHMLLDDLRGRHLVLIDTIGMSQRDCLVAEQAALMAGGRIRRLLLLSATCNAATLDDVIRVYRMNGVEGCILTKVDEAAILGTAVDAIIRHRLPLHYVTNGQRVPEDLHLANRGYLAHRALKPPASDPAHALRDEEFPLAMAAGAGAMTGGAFV